MDGTILWYSNLQWLVESNIICVDIITKMTSVFCLNTFVISFSHIISVRLLWPQPYLHLVIVFPVWVEINPTVTDQPSHPHHHSCHTFLSEINPGCHISQLASVKSNCILGWLGVSDGQRKVSDGTLCPGHYAVWWQDRQGVKSRHSDLWL